MQNSSFVKYNVQKWDTVNMARSVMSRRAHNLCQKFCPRQMIHSLFTSNRPTVRQQFGNNEQCHLQHPPPPPPPLHASPETVGWSLEDSVSSFRSSDACADLIFSACTKQCIRISCKCRMSRLPCTVTCKCHDTGNICYNGWRMIKCFIHTKCFVPGWSISSFFNWLLMSCHCDGHQIPTLRTSVRFLTSWHSE